MQRTYTIKEFEHVTGISAHTLRYFDKVGLLSPTRQANGYRIYSLKQIAIAEVITLLQKAMFTNSEIKELIGNYKSPQTIDALKTNQKKLRDEIISLRNTYKFLNNHIDYLESLIEIRECINEPFMEWQDERVVGLIEPRNIRDIVDFFDAGDDVLNNSSWQFFCTHGMIINVNKVTEKGYPLEKMYVDHDKLTKMNPFIIPGRNYLSMYCPKSMEDNPNVNKLIEYAKHKGFDYESYMFIEQVSGPVIEKNKPDFLVKIMLGEKSQLQRE